MARITRKGLRGQGKAVDAFVPNAQAEGESTDNLGDGQVSEAGTGTQTESRQSRERRQIGILTRMMTGASFIVRK